MNDGIGSDFPLIAAISSQGQGGRKPVGDEDGDITGLRAAVDEPGMSYRSFDNLNHIPGREADVFSAGGRGAALFGEVPFGGEKGSTQFGAAEPHMESDMSSHASALPLFPSADPLMSSVTPPDRPSEASPVSLGAFPAFQDVPREPVAPSARVTRRMRLTDMFQILRGAASGRRVSSDLRDMFR